MNRLLALLAFLSVLIAGCSLPTDEEATVIDPEELPGVLRSDLEITTTTEAGPQTVPMTIYLIASTGDRKIAVPTTREISPRAGFAERIGLLFGVEIRTEEERELGWSNTLREFTLTEAFVNDNEVAVVDMVVLDEQGAVVPVEAQVLADAAAQLVYTATGLPGIGAVRIRIDGEARSLPTSEGDSDEVLRRSDFERYDPDFIPSTTLPPSTTTPDEGAASTTTSAP